MDLRQFDLIADLLRVADPARSAVRDIVVDGRAHHEATDAYACPPEAAAAAIERIRATELSIRGAFVIHGAAEWRSSSDTTITTDGPASWSSKLVR